MIQANQHPYQSYVEYRTYPSTAFTPVPYSIASYPGYPVDTIVNFEPVGVYYAPALASITSPPIPRPETPKTEIKETSNNSLASSIPVFEPEKPSSGAPSKLRKPRSVVNKKWTQEEDDRLRDIINVAGAKNWKRVASELGNNRTDVQCLHRWRKVIAPGLIKGPWTKEEDDMILKLVGEEQDPRNIRWSNIASHLQGRIGKQCRERYLNYLQKNLRKDSWTEREDMILFEIHRIIGNKWSELTRVLPGRSENSIKNRYNSKTKVYYYLKHPDSLLPDQLKTLHDQEVSNGIISATTSPNILPYLIPYLPPEENAKTSS